MRMLFIRKVVDWCLTLLLFFHIQWAEMTTFLEGNPPGSVQTMDICQGETFQPRCGSGYVTIIQNATYGRMTLGRCIKIDMGFLGCKSDVTALTEMRCSGRNSCDVTIPDEQFEQQKPCFELQSYLNVSYFCLKVLTASEHTCSESHFLKTTMPSGYISSQKMDCPNNNIWLVEARAGQQINLTLIDFSVKYPQDDFFSDLNVCQKYADVRDSVTGKEFVICGKRRRQKHILVSQGNAVEIDFSDRNIYSSVDELNEFLIYFQTIGCGDPPLAANTWSKRQGQKIFVGCRDSGPLYEMSCQGTVWIGSYKNCSADDRTEAVGHHNDNLMFSTLPKGLVIAAIIAIAIVVGTVIVVIGVIIFKRRRNQDYVDGAYTIPNSEKVYVSPDSRHHSDMNTGGVHSHHSNKHMAYNSKHLGYPPPVEHNMDSHQKSVIEHDYHCVETPVTAQVAVDRRGYAHVWERPLPAPESQHSC